MATNLSPVLREIHRLRKHLSDLRNEIERGPRVLKAQLAKMTKHEEENRAAHDHVKKLQLQIRDQEGTFKTVNQKLEKVSAQLEKAGSSKEFEAGQNGVNHGKKESARLEEAILNDMTELEEKTAQFPAVDRQLSAAKEAFAQFQEEAKVRHARLVTEVELAESELKKAEADLPPAVKPLYERLVTSYKEGALAGATNRTCQNCHTTITESQHNGLRSGDFVCCSSCGRALYWLDE